MNEWRIFSLCDTESVFNVIPAFKPSEFKLDLILMNTKYSNVLLFNFYELTAKVIPTITLESVTSTC